MKHEEKEKNKPVTYSYSFFHIIFSLASMYLQCFLTGWSTSVGRAAGLVDVGWPYGVGPDVDLVGHRGFSSGQWLHLTSFLIGILSRSNKC
ncbi:putative serine incorporator/TMS membrane protein [Helianthus annuus]|nr:putative serine incorporator/TMS membrane protein [Helianthus annuus]